MAQTNAPAAGTSGTIRAAFTDWQPRAAANHFLARAPGILSALAMLERAIEQAKGGGADEVTIEAVTLAEWRDTLNLLWGIIDDEATDLRKAVASGPLGAAIPGAEG